MTAATILRLSATADSKHGQEVCARSFDRCNAYEEGVSDLYIATLLREEQHYFAFATGLSVDAGYVISEVLRHPRSAAEVPAP